MPNRVGDTSEVLGVISKTYRTSSCFKVVKDGEDYEMFTLM